MNANMNMPIAYVVKWYAQKYGDACDTVDIICPYCGQIHHHGAGDGSRSPHCSGPSTGDGDYMLMGTENARLVDELQREHHYNASGHPKSKKPKTQAPKRTASYGERGRVIIDPKVTSDEEAGT